MASLLLAACSSSPAEPTNPTGEPATITLDVNLVPPDINSVVIRNSGLESVDLAGWTLSSPGFESIVRLPGNAAAEPQGSYGVHQIRARERDCPGHTPSALYLCYSPFAVFTPALHASGVILLDSDGAEVARWTRWDD